MRIIEITDKKSFAILEYIKQLSRTLKDKNKSVDILDWNEAFIAKADIKHFHYSNSTVKIILPLLFANKDKSFVTIHDVIPRNKKWRKYIAPILYRIIDNKTKAIIVHSQHAKDLLRNNFPFVSIKKIKIIPYGTLQLNYSEDQFIKLRKKFLLSKDDIVFLYVGFIKKSKGIYETIEAFKKIELKNTRLFFVGKILENDINEYFNKVKDKRVKYLGFVSDNDLNNWLIITDAVVNFRLNSVGETSASVINTLNLGKPVIATNIGSSAEILGKAGLLCNITVQDIYHAMNEFVTNTKKRNSLKKTALLQRDNLKWENLRSLYINLFR